MNTTSQSIEKLAAIGTNHANSLDPSVKAWAQLNEEERRVTCAGTQAAIEAHLASLVGGMPSEKEVIDLCLHSVETAYKDCVEVRTLMLDAFAKQTAAMESEIVKQQKYLVDAEKREAALEAKLAAVAKLPEKWKAEDQHTKFWYKNDLEAALSSPPVIEPVPEVKSPLNRDWPEDFSHEMGCMHPCAAIVKTLLKGTRGG